MHSDGPVYRECNLDTQFPVTWSGIYHLTIDQNKTAANNLTQPLIYRNGCKWENPTADIQKKEGYGCKLMVTTPRSSPRSNQAESPQGKFKDQGVHPPPSMPLVRLRHVKTIPTIVRIGSLNTHKTKIRDPYHRYIYTQEINAVWRQEFEKRRWPNEISQ